MFSEESKKKKDFFVFKMLRAEKAAFPWFKLLKRKIGGWEGDNVKKIT